MSKLRNYIETRREEILRQIDELKAELQEIKLAETAIKLGVVNSAPTKPYSDNRSTIKQMVAEVLQGRPNGADAADIVTLIKQEFGEDVARSSLSPQLSRLKEEGKVILEGRIWRLSEFEKGSDVGTSEPSAENGGGLVRAPDFPIASPEGANPSTSTETSRPDFWRVPDDDIPF